jgi:hypothetical protein
LPWKEVYDHIEFINQAIGMRMQWDLAAASFPHTSKKARKDIQNNVDQFISFELDRGDKIPNKHKQYDQMPDEQRVLAVGSSLENEGMGFLDKRTHHREWLKEKGISPDECRLRYTQWRDRVDAAKAKREGDGEPVGGDD